MPELHICNQEARLVRIEEDIKTLQNSDKDNNKNMSDMKQSHAETKIYVTQIFESLKDIKITLAAVTEKPAKRWEQVISTILTVAVTVAVTYFFTRR